MRDTIVRDKIPRTQKRRTFGKRPLRKPEDINGIRDRVLKEQLRLGSERISGRIYRKTFVLEIVIEGSSLLSGFEKRVSGHHGGVSPLRNERRN
jgi:hypothetical protein